MSNYSSVNTTDKNNIDTNKRNFKLACKGIISSILIENTALGSELWDGYDIIAWGNSPQPNSKKLHGKILNGIRIYKPIYDNYIQYILNKFPQGKIFYKGIEYQIPHAIYLDQNNWQGDYFIFNADGTNNYRYDAVETISSSIFYKYE